MELVFLILFQRHHESVQFKIVSKLLNITFKDNLKNYNKVLQFVLLHVRGTKTIVKLIKGYRNFIKDHVSVPKTFAICSQGSKIFLTAPKSLLPDYPALKLTTP